MGDCRCLATRCDAGSVRLCAASCSEAKHIFKVGSANADLCAEKQVYQLTVGPNLGNSTYVYMLQASGQRSGVAPAVGRQAAVLLLQNLMHTLLRK